MKISELIEQLQEIKENNGDLDVKIDFFDDDEFTLFTDDVQEVCYTDDEDEGEYCSVNNTRIIKFH